MTFESEPSSPDDIRLAPCAPGDVIGDKYLVGDLLGSGGMAWVFRATHLWLEQPVALKVLRLDPNRDCASAVARFHREALAAARLSGDATARVMDAGTFVDGSPFLVMECLEGKSLDKVIGWGGPIPIEVAVDYALQACEGVAEAHAAGIVHRDLKPSNLFLTRTADGSTRLKLIDFGVSKFAEPPPDSPRVTRTRELVGSPVYMAPEQMREGRVVDGRADIWSMGVILYELITQGRLPFDAFTLPEICARVLGEKPRPLVSYRHDIPRGLEAVVMRCLAKEPSRRFPTVAELAAALVRFAPATGAARAERVRRILRARSAVAAVRGPVWVWPGRVVRLAAAVGLCVCAAAIAVLGIRPDDVEAAANPPGGLVSPPPPAPAPRMAPDPVALAAAADDEASTPAGCPAPLPHADARRVHIVASRTARRPPAAAPELAPVLAPLPAPVADTDAGRPPPFEIVEFGGRE